MMSVGVISLPGVRGCESVGEMMVSGSMVIVCRFKGSVEVLVAER